MLTLAFECGDEYANTFDEEMVAESSPGHYTIVLRSIWGCPTECPISNRHLCANHGACAFDRDKVQGKL